ESAISLMDRGIDVFHSCGPTAHRYHLTDSASFPFKRLRPTAHRSPACRDVPFLLMRRWFFSPRSDLQLPPRAPVSGRSAEVAMHDELTARQRAITLRLAGRPVQAICAAVGRSAVWFRKWWGRYLQTGPDGLYDRTRANHVAQRIPPELERTILSIRRRL